MDWSEVGRRANKAVYWLADHWLLDVALFVATIGTSLLAEKYASEILRFEFAYRKAVHWGVTSFWIGAAALLVVALLKYALAREAKREKAEEAVEQKRQNEDFQQKMSALQLSANTMQSSIVPAEMLRIFSFTHDNIHKVLLEAFASANSTGVSAAEMVELFRGHIRIVLLNILEMIAEIEPGGPNTVYAANVMRFYREPRLDGERGPTRKEIQSRLLFCPGRKSVGKSMGVLDLDPELSTSMAARGAPDPFLVPFALLVPLRQKNENGRYHVLPGAPLAFHRKETLATDALTMVETCLSAEWELPEKVAHELEAYLSSENGIPIQSIVCHPLMERPDRIPEAILNVHRNTPGCLVDQQRRDRVVYLLRPSTLVLIHLLDRLASYERLARKGPRPDPDLGPVS